MTVYGPNDSSGILEYYYWNKWNLICTSSWSMYNTLVLCSSLGYKKGYMSEYALPRSANSTPEFLQFKFTCTGVEKSLDKCLFTRLHICTTNTALAIQCEVKGKNTFTTNFKVNASGF